MSSEPQKPTVLIAGATGFVGRMLLAELKDYKIIALQRLQEIPKEFRTSQQIEWRQCDLFSLLQIENASQGADIAIYLVHSMLPSARLTQSSFGDTDLILADNFIRACKKNNIRRILYLGGIIPQTQDLSPHLQSRLEVERTLASSQIPVTSLRAGLIIGAGGSSFEMMYLLVKRLPLMLSPRWTTHLLSPIHVQDVVAGLRYCLASPETEGKTFDLGGPDIVSYRSMMLLTARLMKKTRWILTVPLFNPRLSILWIRLITGASPTLIKPLVESLRTDLLPDTAKLLKIPNYDYQPLELSLKTEMAELKPILSVTHKTIRKKSRDIPLVRSVQRLHLPKGHDAAWVAKEYLHWLPKFLSPFLKVQTDENTLCRIKFFWIKKSLLRLKLSHPRSTPDRQLFYIVGGVLASKNNPKDSRLEFREVLGGKYLLAAIHNFSPRLPWYLYKYTQAPLHLWVMKRFGKHLSRK